jgi:predicted permease
MQTTITLIEGVVVMLAVILLAVLLKKFEILKKENSQFLSKLVLKVTLPALIFSTLATTRFESNYMSLAIIMAILEIVCMLLAYFIARMLRFGRGETGALILVSAFGMSTMLGYPLISQIYTGNAEAMEEAVITSEFGVGFLLFIFGPLIAIYFGESAIVRKDHVNSAKAFFISPVFISLILGICFSFIPFNRTGQLFLTLDHFLNILGDANTLLAAFAVGLMIEVKFARPYFLFILIALALKLVLKPVLAYWFSTGPNFTTMMQEVIVIETAMPSAILAAIFANHYKCKSDLVSSTVVISLIISVITITSIFMFLF